MYRLGDRTFLKVKIVFISPNGLTITSEYDATAYDVIADDGFILIESKDRDMEKRLIPMHRVLDVTVERK